MKKRRYIKMLPTALLLLLALSGCSRPLALSERGIVKLIAAEPDSGGYAAHVFFLTARQDAAQDAPPHRPECVTGTGQTLTQALHDAKQKAAKELFFAQNELLLLSDRLDREQMETVIEYFSRENWSRTNTAVYAAAENALPRSPEDWQKLAEGLEKLQQHPKTLTRRISSFSADENWYLPGWEESEAGGIVSEFGTVITPKDDRWRMDGWSHELSRIFLEKSGSLTCLSGDELCRLENIALGYRARQENGRSYLTVTLTGQLEDYGGSLDMQEVKKLVQQETADRCAVLYHLLCLQQGCDVYRFGWHLAALNTPLACEQARQGVLFETDTVQFVCKVQTE